MNTSVLSIGAPAGTAEPGDRVRVGSWPAPLPASVGSEAREGTAAAAAAAAAGDPASPAPRSGAQGARAAPAAVQALASRQVASAATSVLPYRLSTRARGGSAACRRASRRRGSASPLEATTRSARPAGAPVAGRGTTVGRRAAPGASRLWSSPITADE